MYKVRVTDSAKKFIQARRFEEQVLIWEAIASLANFPHVAEASKNGENWKITTRLHNIFFSENRKGKVIVVSEVTER